MTSQKVEQFLKDQAASDNPLVAEGFQTLLNLYVNKLWNQLSVEASQLVHNCKFVSAVNLSQFYEEFVKDFEHRIEPTQLIELITPIAEYIFEKDRQSAYAFLDNFDKVVKQDNRSTVRLQTSKIQLRLNDRQTSGTTKCTDFMEPTSAIVSDLSAAYESVEPLIAAVLASDTDSTTVQSPLVAGPSNFPTVDDTSQSSPVAVSQHQNQSSDTDLHQQGSTTIQQQQDQALIVDITTVSITQAPQHLLKIDESVGVTDPAGARVTRTDPALLAKQDERMVRVNGFKPIGILCERLEIVLQRDKKALEREKLRRERERQAEEAEQKRKERRDESADSHERRRERKRHRHNERTKSPTDKIRSNAVVPQKRNFNRLVQCCYCELIVRQERFGGRESAFCSAECISKRVDLVRKCVKDSERILLIDLKSNIRNSSTNPTIETLEAFINQNPSYNPIIDDARLAAATQPVVDPIQQRRIDLVRIDVRKAIEAGLQKRCKAANMCFSMKRYKELSHDIERALYTVHQDVNVKYRKWFKSFMMVVNDEKNIYFKDVMRDKVSAKRLVTLGEEQMKSSAPVTAVLAAADSTSSDNANALSTVSAVPHIRPVVDNKKYASSSIHAKSAVDEILGEHQSDTTLLHTTHLFDANCQICKEEQAKKLEARKRAEEREFILDEQIKLKQMQQSKPFFPNQQSNQGPMGTTIPAEILDPEIRVALSNKPPPSRHHHMASNDFDPPLSSAASGGDTTPLLDPTIASVSHTGTGTFDNDDPLGLNSVQVGDPLIGEDDGDGQQQQSHHEAGAMNEGNGATFGFDGGAFDDNEEQFLNEAEQPAEQFQKETVEQPFRNEVDEPSKKRFVNQFRNERDEQSKEQGTNVVEQPEEQFINEAEVPSDPWKTELLLVWRGLFVCNKQCFFNCTCTAVSGGRAVFKAGREMMPASLSAGGVGRIHLIGLSDPCGVWEYVHQLRGSWSKSICLMVINRPEDTHEFGMYMDCYEFYNQGTQVGVLDFSYHPTIKDGYVFTLSPGDSLPAVLLPLDGAGLPGWTQHNGCIVLMLVRRMDPEDKQWRRHKLSVGDESWRQQRQQHQQSHTPMSIPLTPVGRADGNERMLRVLNDPRLDYELTNRMGSRLYRFSRLYKCMPMIFQQVFSEISNDQDWNRQ